jgi:hypothetical protein
MAWYDGGRRSRRRCLRSGPYRAEMAVPTRLIPNLAMREKCLTKIGDEAGRHCGRDRPDWFCSRRGMVRRRRRSRRHYHPRTADRDEFRKPTAYCRTAGSTASTSAL